MPGQSLTDLRTAIESASEISAEHRAEMLALVESLESEVAAGDAPGPESEAGTEQLRSAITLAGEVLRQREDAREAPDDHDLGDRLTELEEKAELSALEHPVVANILNAIARLI